MKRNELIKKTIQSAVKFFSEIKRGDKVAIIHGHDLDSICSAAICSTLAQDIFDAKVLTIASQFNFTVTSESLEKIKPKFFIFVDLPEIAQNIFDNLSQFGKILVVDHHPPKKYKEIFYCNPRLQKSDIYMPTSYVAYKIFTEFSKSEKILWIACLGTLGDHGAKQNPDIFKDLRKTFPEFIGKNKIDDEILFRKTLLGKLTAIIGSSEIVARRQGAILALKALLKTKNPNQILSGSFTEAKALLNTYKVVLSEYESVLDDFLANKKIYGKIVFYEIKSHLNLKAALSGSVQSLFKKKIIAIAQRKNESYDISFRRGLGVKTNLGELVKEAVANIPNANGGGHEAAAGAQIPKAYLQKFLKNLF